jgi:hypothetical protein
VPMATLVQRELDVLMTRDVASSAAGSPWCRQLDGAVRNDGGRRG